MGSSFSHPVTQPTVGAKRSISGTHLCLLPSDCTTAMETTDYDITQWLCEVKTIAKQQLRQWVNHFLRVLWQTHRHTFGLLFILMYEGKSCSQPNSTAGGSNVHRIIAMLQQKQWRRSKHGCKQCTNKPLNAFWWDTLYVNKTSPQGTFNSPLKPSSPAFLGNFQHLKTWKLSYSLLFQTCIWPNG